MGSEWALRETDSSSGPWSRISMDMFDEDGAEMAAVLVPSTLSECLSWMMRTGGGSVSRSYSVELGKSAAYLGIRY